MQNQLCKGRNPKTICGEYVREGLTTCENHDHQEDYTEKDLENLTKCSRCSKMFEEKITGHCHLCKEKSAVYRAKERGKKGPIKMCKGICIGNENCDNPSRKNFSTCKPHNFQENYTDEQMKNLIDCSRCRKAMTIECFKRNYGTGLCDSCLDIGKNDREKAREKKKKNLVSHCNK